MSENENKETETGVKEDEPTPLLKVNKRGPKNNHPRSEKQKEQFEKVITKRQENIQKRKEEKKIAAAKLLLENEEKLTLKIPTQKEFPAPTAPRVYDEVDSTSSEDSEQYERYVPKVKTKKIYVIKKKKIDRYESSSSSEEEEEEEIKPVAKNKFKSQRNKKSVIKITETQPAAVKNIPKIKNYFCD